jgi:hypothetical protein
MAAKISFKQKKIPSSLQNLFKQFSQFRSLQQTNKTFFFIKNKEENGKDIRIK